MRTAGASRGLHATSNGARVRALLAAPTGETRLESVATDQGTAPSIVDLVPAAGWDEREAHDLQGVRFAGHEPLRPLVDHSPGRERWVPVRGDDAYEVAVGPIHAGVIESGHFRFHLVGDRILHLDAQLFYKHRGLERAAEGKTLDEGLAYASRACAACAVTNGIAYAHACEDALGLVPTAELARARTILLELERMWSHFNDIAAVCAGVGLAAGNSSFAALTERARRLNAGLTGHRFLFGCVRVGGSALDLGADDVRAARDGDRRARNCLGSQLARAGLQRVVPGPAARHRCRERSGRRSGSGRSGPPRARRGSPKTPAWGAGGWRTRASSPSSRSGPPATCGRAWSSGRSSCCRRSPSSTASSTGRSRPAGAEPGAQEQAIGVGRVESPRGATSCIVERRHDRIERLRLRTGSYANWPVVAHAAADNLLPDFPLINKSFELCYACVDR